MSGLVLVVVDTMDGVLHPASWEALAAGQQMSGHKLVVVLVGKDVRIQLDEFRDKKIDDLWVLEHAFLGRYLPETYCEVLRQLVQELKPDWVIFPHTYQVRDFAPKLAAIFGNSLLGDCSGFRAEEGGFVFERQIFQGRLSASVVPMGKAPHFVSFQVGAIASNEARVAPGKPTVKSFEVDLSNCRVTTRLLEVEAAHESRVKLADADVIVSVGRGIKGPENIPMAERLAKLLGGQLGATRAVCDEGWLPMDHQIGSSGQTVTPKLYIALGISGAIQHLVGMKSSGIIVAINKDPTAPIFRVADYGIVGDIFEAVPAMITELEKKPLLSRNASDA